MTPKSVSFPIITEKLTKVLWRNPKGTTESSQEASHIDLPQQTQTSKGKNPYATPFFKELASQVLASKIVSQPNLATKSNGLSEWARLLVKGITITTVGTGVSYIGGHMYLASKLPGVQEIQEMTGKVWPEKLIRKEVNSGGCVVINKISPSQAKEFFKLVQHEQQQTNNDGNSFISPNHAKEAYKNAIEDLAQQAGIISLPVKEVFTFTPGEPPSLKCPEGTVFINLGRGKATENVGGLTQEFLTK